MGLEAEAALIPDLNVHPWRARWPWASHPARSLGLSFLLCDCPYLGGLAELPPPGSRWGPACEPSLSKGPAPSEPTFLNLRCQSIAALVRQEDQVGVWGQATPSLVVWGTSALRLLWNPSPNRKGSVLDLRCGRGAGKRARMWAEPASIPGPWPQAWQSASLVRPVGGGGVPFGPWCCPRCWVWREPGAR